jgi:hypothetical protein
MTQEDQTPSCSPLAQSVTRDGKTVRIDIYENGEGGWLLEVVDEHWNSTVWDASFSSDREALDEALNTIDEREGIDSLIGSPSGEQKAKDLNQPLIPKRNSTNLTTSWPTRPSRTGRWMSRRWKAS